jgi:hypothetical protein
LSCHPVAVSNGWLKREEAAERVLAALRFFEQSPQGPEPDVTGYKGFYYHFLEMKDGRRAGGAPLRAAGPRSRARASPAPGRRPPTVPPPAGAPGCARTRGAAPGPRRRAARRRSWSSPREYLERCRCARIRFSAPVRAPPRAPAVNQTPRDASGSSSRACR